MYVRVSHPLVTAITASQCLRAFHADFHSGIHIGDINALVKLAGLHKVLAHVIRTQCVSGSVYAKS